MMRNSTKAIITITSLLLTASAFGSSAFSFKRSNYRNLPGWYQGHQSRAYGALKRSCTYGLEKRTISRQWRSVCQQVLRNHPGNDQQARSILQRLFTPYQIVSHGNTIGLFTGYYEPTIAGSPVATKYYRVPLYGKPYNLVRVRIGGRTRYRLKINGRYTRPPSREQISRGKQLSNTPVYAWIHSKIDRFFLQIQGSGSVTFNNGKRVLLGYAGQNGYKYYPIGAYLVDKGYLSRTEVSMQSIIKWLKAHPQQAERVMNLNPSFVFFRKLSTDSPIGAQGVPLTAGYSLAVDAKYTKYTTPVWLSTYLPHKQGSHVTHGKALHRLLIAQDTGGAIKGPIRGDVFWGPGKRAQWLAGHMQSDGKMWVLLPS